MRDRLIKITNLFIATIKNFNLLLLLASITCIFVVLHFQDVLELTYDFNLEAGEKRIKIMEDNKTKTLILVVCTFLFTAIIKKIFSTGATVEFLISTARNLSISFFLYNIFLSCVVIFKNTMSSCSGVNMSDEIFSGNLFAIRRLWSEDELVNHGLNFVKEEGLPIAKSKLNELAIGVESMKEYISKIQAYWEDLQKVKLETSIPIVEEDVQSIYSDVCNWCSENPVATTIIVGTGILLGLGLFFFSGSSSSGAVSPVIDSAIPGLGENVPASVISDTVFDLTSQLNQVKDQLSNVQELLAYIPSRVTLETLMQNVNNAPSQADIQSLTNTLTIAQNNIHDLIEGSKFTIASLHRAGIMSNNVVRALSESLTNVYGPEFAERLTQLTPGMM